MIGLIFDKECFKIISLLSLSPGSRFSRNDIKEKTRLNNVPLDIALKKLLSSKILIKDARLYQANFENDDSKKIIDLLSKQYKKLKELPLDVYFLLIDLISSAYTIKGIEIYLFGSYSKLVYQLGSDVDIAIIASKDFDKNSLIKAKNKLEKKYNKNIEIHDFDRSSFYKNKSDPLIKDILKNGIKLI